MLIRHCLFDHKQNTANALSRLGVSSGYTYRDILGVSSQILVY